MPDAPTLTPGRVVQSCPQAPQFVGDDFTSTHFVPHRSGAGAAQLDEQTGVLLLVEHSAVGAAQVLPHWPQFCGWVRSASHPSSALAEQWANPDRQALGGTTQLPAWHVTAVDPARTLGSAVQSCPHVPQFRGSDFTSAQTVPHRSGVAPVQVALHVGVPPAVEQDGLAALHALLQLPQVRASVRLASHPSSGRAEQCAKPVLQAAGGT